MMITPGINPGKRHSTVLCRGTCKEAYGQSRQGEAGRRQGEETRQERKGPDSQGQNKEKPCSGAHCTPGGTSPHKSQNLEESFVWVLQAQQVADR